MLQNRVFQFVSQLCYCIPFTLRYPTGIIMIQHRVIKVNLWLETGDVTQTVCSWCGSVSPEQRQTQIKPPSFHPGILKIKLSFLYLQLCKLEQEDVSCVKGNMQLKPQSM
ncbi:hypothetical protein FKM82_000057 [Ascaphus truei]